MDTILNQYFLNLDLNELDKLFYYLIILISVFLFKYFISYSNKRIEHDQSIITNKMIIYCNVITDIEKYKHNSLSEYNLFLSIMKLLPVCSQDLKKYIFCYRDKINEECSMEFLLEKIIDEFKYLKELDRSSVVHHESKGIFNYIMKVTVKSGFFNIYAAFTYTVFSVAVIFLFYLYISKRQT